MPDHGCGWEHEPPDRFDAMMRANEHLQYSGSCLWGAPTIEDRSGCRYNEVVLNGWLYTQRLPGIVEAVFYPINGHVDHREGDENNARDIHARFRSRYGLAAKNVPLLSFDVAAARDGQAPFRLG
jgi:hypothetical protein